MVNRHESNSLNNFSITSAGIGEALQRSASALYEAGNTIDESIALVTAGNSVIQNPEQVGTALKTLALRLRGTKTELKNAGLETDNMAESTSQLQAKLKALTHGKVDIMIDANNFKNTTQVLREMANAWQDMTDVERGAALELMGGKRQANILASLISNFNTVEQVIATSQNSAGSALAENEKYLNSIQGRLDQLSNSTQTMWMHFMNSDVVKFLITVATALVKITDQVGLLNVAVAGFIAKTAAKSEKFGIGNWLSNKQSADAIKAAASAGAQVAQTAQNIGSASQTAAAGVTILGHTLKAGSLAFKAFNAAATFGVSLLIGAAINTGLKIWDAYIYRVENLKQEVKELTDEYENANKTFSENIATLTTSGDTNTYAILLDEFKALAAGVDQYGNNIGLTSSQYERYKAICDQIVGVNPKIAAGYDSNTKAIGNNVNILSQLIELQKIAARQNAEEYLKDENLETIASEKYEDFKEAKSASDNVDLISEQKNRDTAQFLVDKFANPDGKYREAYGNSAEEVITNMLDMMGYDEDNIKTILEKYADGYGGYNSLDFFTDFMPEISQKEYAFNLDDGTNLIHDFLEEVEYNYQDTSKYAETVQDSKDGLINTLLQVPISSKDYEQLNDGAQKFITEWIKNDEQFKIPDGASKKDVQDLAKSSRDNIKAMISELADSTNQVEINGKQLTAQDIIDQVYNFDPSTVSWEKYKNQIGTLIDGLYELIGGDGNEFGIERVDFEIAFGLNFEETDGLVEDAAKQIAEFLKTDIPDIENKLKGLTAAEIKIFASIDWSAIGTDGITSWQDVLDQIHSKMPDSSPIVKTYSQISDVVSKYNDIVAQTTEIVSDNTQVTQEYKDALVEAGFTEEDLIKCFGEENGLIVKNAQALRDLTEARKDQIATTIRLTRAHAELQYHEVVQGISNEISSVMTLTDANGELTGANMKVADSLFEQANALRMTINQYQLLESSLLGATNAFTQFSKAKEIDSQNTYGSTLVEMAQTMYDAIYKTGEVGSEAFWAAVKATVPDDIYMGLTPGKQQIQAISRYLQDNLFSGFTINGDSFSIDYSTIESFVKKAQSNGLFSGIGTNEFGLSSTFTDSLVEGEDALQKFADQMGVTKEYVYAIFSEMDKYNTNGMGLSMLFQLDNSTTSQLTILNTQLEQVLATRKRLLEQGGDLSANTAEIARIQSQQASVKTQAKANTEKYLTVSNALKNAAPDQKIKSVLSEDLIIEMKLDGEQTVENAFQQISDWLLQLGEPTVLDLTVSKESVEEEIQNLEKIFGKENLKTNLNILNGVENGELTIDRSELEKYDRLLDLDQLIDDAWANNLTTTETLLDEIATNTGIMAGTKEAPKESKDTNSNADSNQVIAGSATSSDTFNNLLQFMAKLEENKKVLDNYEYWEPEEKNTYNALTNMAARAKEIADMLVNGGITEEGAREQLQILQKQANEFPLIVPIEFKTNTASALSTITAKGMDVDLNNRPQVQFNLANFQSWAEYLQEIVDNIDGIFSDEVVADAKAQLADMQRGDSKATVYSQTYYKSDFAGFSFGEDTDAAVVVTPILPDGTVLSPGKLEMYAKKILNGEEIEPNITLGIFEGENFEEEAAQFAEQLHEEQAVIYGLADTAEDVGQNIGGLLSSGLYKFKQTAISTYSELQTQVSSYNDLQTKTNEIMTSGTEVTQDYVNSLAALIEDQTVLNDCFERVGDKILVKNVDALEELIKVSKKNTANNVKLAKSQAQLKYYKLVKELGQATKGMDGLSNASGDTTKSIKDQIKEVKQAIYQYQLLEDNLLGTTNAFTNYKKAQDIDALNTYGDDYVSMVQTMYDALYKTGEVGTEQFWAAVDATVPTSKLEKAANDAERMKIIYDYLNKEILPSLTVKDGEISMNFENIEKFVKQGIKAGVFTGNTKEFDLVEGLNLDEAAKKLGMTTTQAYTFFALLDKYNVARPEQSFLSQLDDSTSGTIMKLTTQMEELNDKKIALLKDGGYEKNKKQIDAINQQLAENDAKLKEISKDAYTTWQAYTKTDAALAALKEIENKTSTLSEEDAIQLGVKWKEGMTVQDAINQLEEQLANLEATDALTAQLIINGIDIKVADLQSALNKVQNGVELNDQEAKLLADLEIDATPESIQAKIDELNGDKAKLAVDFGIELSEEEKATLQEELNSIEEFTIHDKKFKVTANGTVWTIAQLALIKSLIDKINNTTVTVTTRQKNSTTDNSSEDVSDSDIPRYRSGRESVNVNGTAHAQGTAHKSGSWGAPKTETALTGELGPEILVRGNRWTTVGENGAEFTDVRKGDIIFNHKQTEDLLSKGYITGRGKAFAEGTAYSGLWKPTGSGSGSSSGSGSGKDDKDEFKEIFDWIAVRIEEITERIELSTARLENAIGYKKQNSLIDEIIKTNQKLYDNLTAGAATYYKYSEQLLAKIPAEYRAAAQDGSIAIEEFVGEVREETYNAISDYREWVQKGADLTQQAEETLTEISNLAKQAIDNISAEFENKKSLSDNAISQLEAYNALLETTKGFESANIYQEMIKENNKNIQILRQQRDQMQAELNKRVEAGEIKKYSQDWYDAINSIAEVDTEIINLTADTNEYQDSINELHWEQFDKLLDRLDAISNESNNLIDILGNKDLVDEDTAEWTDEGITSLGLYAQQLEVAEMQAKKYADEIDYLNKNWKALGYTEQEYTEKLEELKEGQYDAIKAYHDTKKSIVDLTSTRVDAIKNGIQKEIEAYEELINKKKEELSSEKDLYDFQKNVKSQTKEIADIERKLAALSSDNSASARAERARLQAQLAEKQQELQDTYYDRSVSDQQEALDKELDSFKEEKDEEIKKWEEYLKDTETVVADALDVIQSNTNVVYNTLSEMGKEYSLSIADSIVSPWQDGQSAIQSYSEKFGLSMSSTVKQLKELESTFKQTMTGIEQSGIEAANTVKNNIESYQTAENKTSARPAQPAGDVIVSGGGSSSSSSSGSYPYGRASDTSGNIKRGAKGDDVRAIQYALNQLGYGNSGTTNLDGNFGSRTENAVKSFQRAMGIKVDGIVGTNTRAKFRANGYASGTTGTKKDELAWIDEMGLEELVMHAGPNGRLQYLSKGTSVVPADLTANLMEWGALDPQNMLDQNRPVINAPHVTNNNIEVNMNFDSVVRVDTVTNDTIPDLTKAIKKEMDKYMKDVNSQIRKYVR